MPHPYLLLLLHEYLICVYVIDSRVVCAVCVYVRVYVYVGGTYCALLLCCTVLCCCCCCCCCCCFQGDVAELEATIARLKTHRWGSGWVRLT